MRKALVLAGTALVTVLGLWACGMENSLVGGECSVGYEPSGDRCVPVVVLGPGQDGATADGASRDGATDALASSDGNGDGDGASTNDSGADSGSDSGGLTDGSTNDAEGGTGETCTPPLFACNGTCVDLENDPLNCGACNNVCPSLLCSNSKCDGTVAGHIVVFGHDYQGTFSSAQRKALGNAALLAVGTTIRVRSYEQYANATAVAQVKSIITTAAQGTGRTAMYTVVTQPSDVDPAMTVANTDVLVVYDQIDAPAATLGGLGSSWASTLASFTHAGGIVIVLDGHGGANPQMPAFLTNSLLLDVSSAAPVAVGTPLLDIASQDAVGLGLVSPYGAGQNTVHFACNEPSSGAVTYVVVDAPDGGPMQPVIVHKVAP